MSKLPNLGVASRFAVLRIEDDDEEESAIAQRRSRAVAAENKSAKFVPLGAVKNYKDSQGRKKKSEKKRNNTADRVGKDETGNDEDEQIRDALRLSQLTYEVEESRRRALIEREEEDVKKAVDETGDKEESSSAGETGAPSLAEASASNDSVSYPEGAASHQQEADEEAVSVISELAKEATIEAKKIIGSFKGRQAGSREEAAVLMYKLYKAKFEELVNVAKEMEKDLENTKLDLIKTMNRNKELL